jgi:5-methylcytosine-specific restriction protein B
MTNDSISDEDLLKHFDVKPGFKAFRASWSQQDKTTFCRLVRAAHAAGLDCWLLKKGFQVRFGRKNPGSERANGVLGVIQGRRTRRISWRRDVGDVRQFKLTPLTDDLVKKIEDALVAHREMLDKWLVLETERSGLWPDQLLEDPPEPDEKSDGDEKSMGDAVTQAFNRIYYGPPGTGKTYKLINLLKDHYGLVTADVSDELKKGPELACADQRYSFVTFHQSYGYEEFVEGLRPVLTSGAVQYEIRSGVFKDLCSRARKAPKQRFAMVIDEINRGNISKIFGELITLIEADKRYGAENAISVTLPYSGESFSVPANVDIIGTMNTADRSLALLDTALRRRFEFVPIPPDASDDGKDAPLADLCISIDHKVVIKIPNMLAAINLRIEALYDRDHCIGHAYFTVLKQIPNGQPRFDALKEVFRNRIIPLLEEYFFEDWQKIRLVLADNKKKPIEQFIAESANHENDLIALFGRDHGLDTFSTKPRFHKQVKALDQPGAYIGIYEEVAD